MYYKINNHNQYCTTKLFRHQQLFFAEKKITKWKFFKWRDFFHCFLCCKLVVGSNCLHFPVLRFLFLYLHQIIEKKNWKKSRKKYHGTRFINQLIMLFCLIFILIILIMALAYIAYKRKINVIIQISVRVMSYTEFSSPGTCWCWFSLNSVTWTCMRKAASLE